MSNKLSIMLTKTFDKHFGNTNKSKNDSNNVNDTNEHDTSSSVATETVLDNYIDNNENTNLDIDGIRVENEEIIINEKNIESGNNLTIMSCEGIKLYINNELCKNNINYNVTSLDELKMIYEEIPSKRSLDVSISKDCMEAYVNIDYVPEFKYKLKDRNTRKNMKLKTVKEVGGYPKKFTITEIMNILGQNKIKYGIIKENILLASSIDKSDKILVAKGNVPVDDKPMEVKILFDLSDKKDIIKDDMDKVDYKNVYSISNIEIGQVLAEIIPEESGIDGRNVKGETLKRKTVKSRPVKAGDGCKIENNKVIATKCGRPSSKNGILSVNNVYNIKDVDMKSGNINFVGDVEINGSVCEGMTVKAGNSILIQKDIDSATIIAGGEINLKGNIINSKIHTGQVDIEKKEYLDILNVYKSEVEKLLEGVIKLNESSNSKKKISDLTRILIESRYKDIPKLSLNIISRSIRLYDENDNELINFLRKKVMGLNISNIKTIKDLETLKRLVEEEIDYYSDDMIIQSDIYAGYVQDSLIKSTGNIFITGKGEYVSNLIALSNIEFLNSNAVARGGFISARGNVKLGTIGSLAGVTTRVEVPADKVITAEVAYANTIFAFGKRSKTLEDNSKNVKAYMNKDGDIVIEKLKL